MAAHSSSRLLILACSVTKREGPACVPAIQRYDGSLWQTLRAVDPYGEKAKVALLSAHLGFRAASSPIETYDARMTDQVAAAMKVRDLGTRWPRLDVMRHLVELFRTGGYVVSDARVREINGPIGQMRRDLRLWLDGHDGEGP